MVNDYQAPPMGAEQRLQDHHMQLPPVPTPLGAYAEVVQTGSLLFPSGMMPQVDGKPAPLARLRPLLTA